MTKKEIARAYLEARDKDLKFVKTEVARGLMSLYPDKFNDLDSTRKCVASAAESSPPNEEPLPISPDYAADVYKKHKEKETKKKQESIEKELISKKNRVEELEKILDIKESTSHIEITPIVIHKGSGNSETTSISLLSDVHIEEVVKAESVLGKNEYNPEIAKTRLNNYFANLVKLINHHQKNYRIRRHIIGILGDIISGFIHEELRQTNAFTPPDAVFFAKQQLMSGLAYLQENLDVDRIDVVCIVGNHGRITEKLHFNNLTETSYEYFMYKDLQEMCAIMKLDKIHFTVPKASMAIMEVYGKNYLFEHGNQFRYMGGVGGLYIPFLKHFNEMATNFKVERIFFGHHHTTVDIKQGVGNGSVIGYSSFGLGRFSLEPPQQSLVLLNEKRGFTNFQPIFLDE